MAISGFNPFPDGFRLISGTKLNRIFSAFEYVKALASQTTLAAVGNVSTGAYFIESAVDSVAAHAGGGQTSATLLTAANARVTTVTSIADSVKIGIASTPGATVTVLNSGANSLQLFGLGTDTINGAAAATGVAVAAGHQANLTCYTAGAWLGPVALA